MKKDSEKILVITIVLILVLISVCHNFQNPAFMQDVVNTQGAWWITSSWLGWRNQDDQYQKYTAFYEGESIKGIDFTLTYKQANGYGNPTKWRITGEIQDTKGTRIKGFSTSGGALTPGQSITAVCDFSTIVLSTSTRLHGDVTIEVYNPTVGWEGGVTYGGLPVNVQPNLPSFTLDYYQVSATTVKPGDAVTVSYQYTNNGRASGTLYVSLWVDKWKRGEN
jgi:hypothetical protein